MSVCLLRLSFKISLLITVKIGSKSLTLRVYKLLQPLRKQAVEERRGRPFAAAGRALHRGRVFLGFIANQETRIHRTAGTASSVFVQLLCVKACLKQTKLYLFKQKGLADNKITLFLLRQ